LSQPSDWIAWILGYNQIQVNGVFLDAVNVDQIQTLNFINFASVVINSANRSIDITAPSGEGGGGGPDTRVTLNHSTSPPGTPVTLTPYTTSNTYYVIDLTSGSVGVVLPASEASGQSVAIKLKVGVAVSGTVTFTCTAGGGGTVEVPMGASNGSATVMSPGTSSTEFIFNAAAFQGAGLRLEVDASNNWEIRA
jgi:hypothetical protein